MKTGILLLLTLFLTIGCDAPVEPASNPGSGHGTREIEWSLFEGAWFSIEYPGDFVVKPSLAANEDGLYDSAFFSTKDDGVSFYVLSPQWRRAASDTVFKTTQELRVDLQEQNDDGLIKNSALIRAKDESSERLIETFASPDQTVSWTFQFIYRNEELKEQYAPLYDRFKASLQQFSD